MIGGSPDELRLVELGLAALAEKLDVMEMRAPELLASTREHVREVLRRLEPTTDALTVDAPDDEVMRQPIAFTIPEAANQVRMSEKTIQRAYESGELKVARIGRSVRVRPDALIEWIQSQEDGTG